MSLALAMPVQAGCKKGCGGKTTKASISIGSTGAAGNVGGGTVIGNGPKGVVTGSVTAKKFDANSAITYNNGKTNVTGSTSGNVATAGISAAFASGTDMAEASTFEEGGAAVSSQLVVKK